MRKLLWVISAVCFMCVALLIGCTSQEVADVSKKIQEGAAEGSQIGAAVTPFLGPYAGLVAIFGAVGTIAGAVNTVAKNKTIRNVATAASVAADHMPPGVNGGTVLANTANTYGVSKEIRDAYVSRSMEMLTAPKVINKPYPVPQTMPADRSTVVPHTSDDQTDTTHRGGFASVDFCISVAVATLLMSVIVGCSMPEMSNPFPTRRAITTAPLPQTRVLIHETINDVPVTVLPQGIVGKISLQAGDVVTIQKREKINGVSTSARDGGTDKQVLMQRYPSAVPDVPVGSGDPDKRKDAPYDAHPAPPGVSNKFTESTKHPTGRTAPN